MPSPVHPRTVGAPLPSQQPQPQQAGQQPMGAQQHQQGPQQHQQAGQQPMGAQQQQQGPPLSLLIGVAVQAAAYWQPDDPDRPEWAAEAQKAIQDWLGSMPARV